MSTTTSGNAEEEEIEISIAKLLIQTIIVINAPLWGYVTSTDAPYSKYTN
jgi:hypothetical protein